MHNGAEASSHAPGCSAERDPSAGRRIPLSIATTLLLAVGAVLYFPVLSFQFVWDDHGLILENPYLQPGHLAELLRLDFWMASARRFESGYYRPVVTTTYFIDRALWGDQPLGFHLTNLLLHLANALLAFSLLDRLTGRRAVALLAALLFLVHPLHAEPVANVASRTDLLATFFGLAALTLLARLPARRPLLTAAGCGAAALLVTLSGLSKELAVMLLPLEALVLILFPGGWKPRRLWLIPLGSVAAGLLVMVALRIAVLGSFTGQAGLVSRALTSDVLLTLPQSALLPLSKMLFPLGLSARYPSPSLEPFSLAAAGAILVWGTVFTIALLRRRSAPFLLFGFTWFGLALLPTALLLPSGLRMSDLFAYLPGIGLHVIFASALLTWSRPPTHVRLGMSAGAVVLLAVVTRLHLPVWHDDLSLWSDTVRKQPEDALAWMNLGNALLDLGREDDARRALEQAVQLSGAAPAGQEQAPTAVRDRDTAAKALFNLGNLYRRQGTLERAAVMYQRSSRLLPDFLPARQNLALTAIDLGALEPAERELHQTLARFPRDPRTLNLLGIVAAKKGARTEAERWFRAALEVDPSSEQARHNLDQLLKTPP